jgi:tetratricopeptide (TPR) repeat protein
MAISAISRPVGKRISCKHFFESMKLILVASILLLALMTSAQCQQTVALNGKSNVLPLFFDETTTYTFIKDIGRAEDVELIKVHFKNIFRGADQNLAIVDRIWQVSETNSSQVIINDSHNKRTITSGTPLKLVEGYELAIKGIDIDGVRVNLELSKNGNVIDSTIIVLPEATDDLYIYSKDIGSAKDVEVIKLHFKNAFRGADQNVATVDRVWQVSDINSSQVINNNSSRLTLTSGTPLMLEEGYELAIKSIDINGNKVYVELSKNGNFIDYGIIIPPQTTDDLYTYSTDIGSAKDVEVIKLHFKNAFRGADQNVATVDRVWQVSDTNSSQVIINDSNEKTITSGTPLKLEEGYELAIKSIDIDGNKVFMELSKNGEVIDSRIIIQNPWYNKGIALAGQGKYDEAIQAYDEAIELHPNWAEAWYNKGNALDKLEKYDEAIKSYNKAIKLNANVSTSIIDKGNSHYNAGEYVAAIRYYDEAIKQDPKDEYAWYNKAMALRMLHRDSEAKVAYTKARELGYSGTMTLMEMTA